MRSHNKSEFLFKRASRVIPGGTYGHIAPASGLPRHFAHFCSTGQGAFFQDVDGNEWIDFMCAYGAVLHGYQHPRIEEAVEKQRKLGSIFNHPNEVVVELAEKLTQMVDFASWSVFAKNGSDLTTWAIRVAREQTKRSLVVKAVGAYHGVDAWCDPGLGGRIDSDRSDVVEFEWNNLNQLEDIFKQSKNKVAAVILTPYHHAAFAPSEMPLEDFWIQVRSLCTENGSLLILDDVRAGWRLYEGGSHRYFNFTPDMSVYSKALGNGYAISACVGIEPLKGAASEVFLTGSCWNDAVAMRAALTSITMCEEKNVPKSVMAKGQFFCERLEEQAKKFNYSLKMTGPPSMPYPWFEGDENLFLIQKFCQLASEQGLYFHPHHNWFISDAHDQKSLERALELAGRAFEELDSSLV
jgi:glutamate-1-semialdehyde 2,1-aminomutase